MTICGAKMTKKVIVIHSYKGGTGKTAVAANLAVIYARQGYNVCLIDYDLRAPNLNVLFNVTPSKWFNDFLEGHCDIKATLVDVNSAYATKGRLALSLSDPAKTEEMIRMNEKLEMKALKRILKGKADLSSMGFDIIILDTAPGLHYSSANAMIASEGVAVILRPNRSDMVGTKELVRIVFGRLDHLRENIKIIVNNFVPKSETTYEEERKQLIEHISDFVGLPVIDVIRHYCELLRGTEEAIYASVFPEHPFVLALKYVADQLLR